jgi:DNA-binding response OmpR family regulator
VADEVGARNGQPRGEPKLSHPFEHEPRPTPAGVLSVGRILLADGDPDLSLTLERTLRAEGHEVVTVRTGEDAIRVAREELPWLLILDVGTPGINGYDVCRRLRADWRFADLRIIMLTSASLATQRALGLAAGADDFVRKPFDPLELAARVQLTLGRAQGMRSSSPLTGLPGNVHIEQELQRRVQAGQETALLYVDLDNFKAYNDHYGFLRGDEVIRALADVLRSVADQRPGAFLGHVGGDDFVVLARPHGAERVAWEIIAAFEARVPALYDPDAAARGWIDLTDRRGRTRRYGLLSVSIGVATNVGRPLDDHRRLVDLATEMKHYAKSREGNAVAVDRRSGQRLGALPGPAPDGPNANGPPGGSGGRLQATIGFASARPGRSPRNGVSGKTGRGPARGRRSLGRRLVMYPAAALVALALVGGPATVVMAENAQPGQILYPLKLRIEEARLMLEPSREKDLALRLEFAARRLAELQNVMATGTQPSLVPSVTANLSEHTEMAAVTATELVAEHPGTRGLVLDVQVVLGHNTQVLQALVAAACQGVGDRPAPPAAACDGLQRALHSSSKALERAVELREAGGAPMSGPPIEPSGKGPPQGGEEPRGHEGAKPPATKDRKQPPDVRQGTGEDTEESVEDAPGEEPTDQASQPPAKDKATQKGKEKPPEQTPSPPAPPAKEPPPPGNGKGPAETAPGQSK